MLLPADPAQAFVPYPAHDPGHAQQGPLAGLTFGVKDLFDVAGYPTSAGNPVMLARSGIKTRHAQAVARLLDAGARFVGKCHTEEFAFSVIGSNPHFATPVNGKAPNRFTGGSSSGSAAAVSNGLCDVALGTDTGGSVRVPASHCGLVGLRPTHGRIPLQGCHDLAPAFDTCGFFARDLATFERVARVLLDPREQDTPRQWRAWDALDAWSLSSAAVQKALAPARKQALSSIGGAGGNGAHLALESFEAMTKAFRDLQSYQAWQTNGPLIERHDITLGPGVAERHYAGRDLDPADLASAIAFRERFAHHLTALLGNDRVMILPTVPDVSPLRDQTGQVDLDDYRWRVIALTCAASLAGLPQLSLPVANCQGAPIGLSLMGPADSDLSLIALARRLELAP